MERYATLRFAPGANWETFATDPWWCRIDLRDMLNLFHPLMVSHTGAAAGARCLMHLAEDWQPPLAVRFYCADDYFADPDKHRPGQPSIESFFGHRFKQVLVDDQVVWSRDVIDSNLPGSPCEFTVDLPAHLTPGSSFWLTLRVIDQTSTLERNPQDVWFIGGAGYHTHLEAREHSPRFHTAVWFADPVVGEAEAVRLAPPGQRPHDAVVVERHGRLWPRPPRSAPLPASPSLALDAPVAIPAGGFPLRCGIPMPPGRLTHDHQVELRTATGQGLPAHCRRAGSWPDGSVRVLLLDTVVAGATRPDAAIALDLATGTRTALAAAGPAPISAEQAGPALAADNGLLRIELGTEPGQLLGAVRLAGQGTALLRDLRLHIEADGDGSAGVLAACRQQAEIVERNCVLSELEVRGELELAGAPVGRYVFRLFVYAGLQLLQTQFRFFCDRPQPEPLPIRRVSLEAAVDASAGDDELVFGGTDDAPLALEPRGQDAALRQEGPDAFQLLVGGAPQATGARAAGWMTVKSADTPLTVAVRHFWQQAPKALARAGGRLRIDLVAATDGAAAYQPRPGEAKRHEVWWAFGDAAGDQAGLSRLVQEPPRLLDRAWFCGSGALGVLDPAWFARQPQVAAWVADKYGDAAPEKVTGHFGIRAFGDMPYGTGGGWMNGYWAMVQGSLNWGLSGAGRAWMERCDEIARHVADVDTVHLPSGHPDWEQWNGVTCTLLCRDHSAHEEQTRWPAFQLGESLVLHYWMTGDRDSLNAAVANAEYLLRTQAGLGSGSAREQARPMLTLLRVWQATGDGRYLEGAKRYFDLGYQTRTVLDWRRGAYIQETYANWHCISAGLDSMYAHNVYEYYRITGDIDAARLVVAIADSVYDESMLPQEEGLGSFLFYVRYSRNSWYYPQMAMLFCMAFDLTSDRRFLRAVRAAFARYLLCRDANGQPFYQPYNNFGWLDPELGGWLLELESVGTEPFTITSQTPDPDPSCYASQPREGR